METFITVSFWLGVVAFVINFFTLCTAEFPRRKSVSLGQFLAGMMISTAFMIWAGFLIFRQS